MTFDCESHILKNHKSTQTQERRQRPEGRLAILQTLPTPRTERTEGP